jgi:DNA polymerase Pol2
MSSLLSGVDSSVTRIPSSSPSRGGNRRKRKPSLDDAYDSGSITQPSSDGFDMPNSQLLFRGARSNGQEEDNGEDIGLWEMRNTDSIKKPRLVVKSEAEDTPKNGRRGVSFAESTADDSFTMDFDDNTNGETKAIDVDDDDEDFLVRSDRAIEAKANSSKARDRLMAAIGVKKETESTPKTSAMKNRRTMVNGSAISTKVEAQAQARAKAEELATEIQNQDLPQIVNKGKTERQNWLKLQETLNTGKLEDEASLGNPFNATAAAQKKYIPTLRVDAFEPLEGDAESEMDVDSDGEHSDSSIKARQNRRESKKKAQSEDSTADRTLRFFWIDYLEENGLVHLLGKAYDRSTEKYVSCCVTVKNIQRNLFVLPRERRVDADDYETDAEVSVMDVHQEFDALRRKHGVEGGFGMKKVTRKYAFEQREVPQGESDWYKVIYGFDQPQLPGDLSGATFSKIFGSNTSAFEILVLKRKIMGPCWLEVKGCVAVTQKPATWCRLEVRVDNPKDVNSFSEADANAPKEMPPITVMSINARTIINHNMNSQEILAVTTAIWEGYNIDDPTPVEKLRHVPQTIVRPLGEKFPPNFEVRAPGQQIKTVRTERELLNLTLIQIQRADPDVIVGHEFLGTVLEILLTRMKELKADHWSRIGRIRRTQLRIGKQGFTNAKYLAGRLVADLSSEGAKSTIDSVTWSLTEMCGTQLGFTREEIDPDDTAGYFDGYAVSPDRLLHFIRHLQMDAFAQMAITAKVQLLPLTKQLTNLAGNSWNRTLTGARAQRNEYILLHEFHRLKYICPDKSEGKPSSRAAKKINLDEDGKPIVEAKKNKYQGGLVFEPKRGLWDTYVMVMDFNSLYPSIIQEYNIDFTTVERDADAGEDDIPDIPSSDIPQGVLPRLIATLVGRRKQVKSLMKDSSNSPVKMMQYDIKQKALKLTANSMYGCLGFAGSRFYARPLAALTTFKGRETLTQTKEVAEGLSLDVSLPTLV